MDKKYETFSSQQDPEMDLKPFINFLVVLIPVLMISAEFSKIAVIEASASRGSDHGTIDSSRRPLADRDLLGLTLLVTDSTITLGSNNGFLPTIFYKESHTYVSRENRNIRVTAEYNARNPEIAVINPATQKPFGLDEREAIALYVINDNKEIVQCLYTKNGGMVTDEKGTPLSSVRPGEKVVVPGPFRAFITVDRAAGFTLKPLSAYDDLRNKLALIRQRAGDVSDRNSIKIAAESSVMYDKIIQLMDAARGADFGDISIAKIRG